MHNTVWMQSRTWSSRGVHVWPLGPILSCSFKFCFPFRVDLFAKAFVTFLNSPSSSFSNPSRERREGAGELGGDAVTWRVLRTLWAFDVEAIAVFSGNEVNCLMVLEVFRGFAGSFTLLIILAGASSVLRRFIGGLRWFLVVISQVYSLITRLRTRFVAKVGR